MHLGPLKTELIKEELAKKMAALTPGFSGEKVESDIDKNWKNCIIRVTAFTPVAFTVTVIVTRENFH